MVERASLPPPPTGGGGVVNKFLQNFYFAAVTIFDVASYLADKPYTITNPVHDLVFILSVWFFVMMVVPRIDSTESPSKKDCNDRDDSNKNSKDHHVLFLIYPALAAYLVSQEVLVHAQYHYANDHHPSMWLLAIVIHTFGSIIMISAVLPRKVVIFVFAVLLPIAILFSGYRAKISLSSPCTATDYPWWEQQDNPDLSSSTMDATTTTNGGSSSSYYGDGVLYKSLFVPGAPLDDGSPGPLIAVDVYLPKNYSPPSPPSSSSPSSSSSGKDNKKTNKENEDHGAGGGLPTYLHMTRYTRRHQIRWPFSILFGNNGTWNTRSFQYVDALSPHGYAVVTMDVRGTGASGGHRKVEVLPEEVDDYVAVYNWVKEQPWCNGKIASGGISYDGMTATALASRGVGLSALIVLFTPQDAHGELLVPGGVTCIGFLESYYQFTRAVEILTRVDSKVPMSFLQRFFTNVLFAGPASPSGQEEITKWNIAEHSKNSDAMELGTSVRFADTIIPNTDVSSQQLYGTFEVLENIMHHQVPTYVLAGYYDSGSVRAALRWGNAAKAYEEKTGKKAPQVKIIIGPWSHGLRRSMTSSGVMPCYPMFSDVRQFFDTTLKNNQTTTALSSSSSIRRRRTNHHDLLPPSSVSVFDLGSETWHHYPTFDDLWQESKTEHHHLTVVPSTASTAGEDEEEQQEQVLNKNKQSSSLPVHGEHHKPLLRMVPSPMAPYATTTATNDNPLLLSPAGGVPLIKDIQLSKDATTGVYSRWNLVQHILKNPIIYPDMYANRTCFITDPVSTFLLGFGGTAAAEGGGGRGATAPITLVGSPIATISLVPHDHHYHRAAGEESEQGGDGSTTTTTTSSSSSTDVYVFVTLEEVFLDEDNKDMGGDYGSHSRTAGGPPPPSQQRNQNKSKSSSYYISEGQYRVGFEPMVDPSGTARTFTEASFRSDAVVNAALTGKPLTFTIPLEPIQYQLKSSLSSSSSSAGTTAATTTTSALRMCLAGYDKDNFLTPNSMPKWSLYAPTGLSFQTLLKEEP